MKKHLKSFLIAGLIIQLLLSSSIFGFFPSAEESARSVGSDTLEQISEKTVVAENDSLLMTIDKMGHFSILNKKTEYVWHSYPTDILENNRTIGINRQNFQSEIVVNYVYKDTFGDTSSYEKSSISGADAIATESVTVYKLKNGARVTYDFYAISASVSVDYKLSEDCFSAKISGSEILEDKAFIKKVKNTATEDQLEMVQSSYITSIWLLPAFCTADINSKGYVFVPDGCGAYMDCGTLAHTTENVNIPVYGKEETIDEYGVWQSNAMQKTRGVKAYFPMFAVSQNGNGMMGVISKGDAISSINAYKANKVNAYTGVSPQVDYRTISYVVIGGRKVQGISKIKDGFADFKVDYYFFSNAPSFVQLSEYYRELLKTGGKINTDNNGDKLGLALNIIGAIDMKSHILGFPCKKVSPLTTYSEANKIISGFKKSSVDSISVNYIGWNNNGVQNNKITNSAKPLSKLGGETELNSLLKNAKKSNVQIYFDADLQTLKSGGNGISKLNGTAKTVFDKPATIRKILYSVFSYEKEGLSYISKPGFGKVFNKYLKSADNLSENAGLSFNSISHRLYSDFSTDNLASRAEFLKTYKKSISKIERKLSANDANAYMWQFVGKVFEAPASSSRQMIYDGEIPMYQMILKGSVNLTSPSINSSANRRNVFLRAVETGSELCFTVMYKDSEAVSGTDYDYLYGTTYSAVFKDAVLMYKEYAGLLDKISNAVISDYSILDDGVVKTTYSNGLSVYVNYNNTDYKADEQIIVPANGFCY